MKRLATWTVVALSVLVAILVVCRTARKPGREGDQPALRGESGRTRPGAGYKPKAEPLRHARRPMLPVTLPSGNAEEGGVSEATGMIGSPAEDVSGGAAASIEKRVAVDSGLETFSAETAFAARAWSALESSDEDLLAAGEEFLRSSSAEDRALGGVMLFFAKGLHGEALDQIVGDEDLMVPLAVCDWVRDFGTESDIQMFKEAFKARGLDADELLDMARNSATLPGGGRSALDLWLEEFPEDGKPIEGLAALVASPDASYDVREQALFKLLEPETKAVGLEALKSFANGLADDAGGLLPDTARKLSDLALVSNSDGDDEKIWDSEAAVVFFLSQAENGLPARDLANYLEYALRRDDPEYEPVIEEGTWEFANDFLLEMMPYSDTLSQAEVDALDRIAMSLDRLIDYDPAFNPFETVEDDGDEEDDDAEEVEEDEEGEEDDDTDADDADDDADEEDDADDEDEEDDDDSDDGSDADEEDDEDVEEDEGDVDDDAEDTNA